MAEVKITGLRELNARMAGLSDKLREAAGRRAARAAMAIVREDARRRLAAIDSTLSPEDIRKNVFIQQSRSQSREAGGVVMRVGILGGARAPMGPDPQAEAQPGGDTRHWRYIELGTESTPARPFLRPALEQNQQAVFDALAAGLNSELDRLAKGT